jgi:proteasome lid subunit RPN8/RPN11
MLRLSAPVYTQIVGHCLTGLPDEACGLLGGDLASGTVARCYPTRNLAASAKLYTVDPAEHLRADRDAESRGTSIIGVFHSHTHTDAYPSPTDVVQAPDPEWHYVLVSLRDTHPVLRSYRITGPRVDEESVIIEPHEAPRPAFGPAPDGSYGSTPRSPQEQPRGSMVAAIEGSGERPDR